MPSQDTPENGKKLTPKQEELAQAITPRLRKINDDLRDILHFLAEEKSFAGAAGALGMSELALKTRFLNFYQSLKLLPPDKDPPKNPWIMAVLRRGVDIIDEESAELLKTREKPPDPLPQMKPVRSSEPAPRQQVEEPVAAASPQVEIVEPAHASTEDELQRVCRILSGLTPDSTATAVLSAYGRAASHSDLYRMVHAAESDINAALRRLFSECGLQRTVRGRLLFKKACQTLFPGRRSKRGHNLAFAAE